MLINDYKPKKSSKIDMLVYKALKSFGDSRLTIERVNDQGWYKFGSVKVFMKLPADGKNDVIAQVGGGFTFVMDFLELEHEKIVKLEKLRPVVPVVEAKPKPEKKKVEPKPEAKFDFGPMVFGWPEPKPKATVPFEVWKKERTI